MGRRSIEICLLSHRALFALSRFSKNLLHNCLPFLERRNDFKLCFAALEMPDAPQIGNGETRSNQQKLKFSLRKNSFVNRQKCVKIALGNEWPFVKRRNSNEPDRAIYLTRMPTRFFSVKLKSRKNFSASFLAQFFCSTFLRCKNTAWWIMRCIFQRESNVQKTKSTRNFRN